MKRLAACPHRKTLFGLLGVFLGLCPPAQAQQAGSFGTYSFVNAVVDASATCTGGTVTPAPAPSSAAVAGCTDGVGTTGSGSAAANYGVLGAFSTSAAGGPSNGFVSVDSYAVFVDTLHISGPATGVYLSLSASLTGGATFVVTSGGSGSSATVSDGGALNLKAYSGAYQCATGFVTGAAGCSILVPVDATGTVDIWMQVVASTSYSTLSSAWGSSTADFSHTGVLSGAAVTDATGNPLAGYSITSDSGTQYPVHALAFTGFYSPVDNFPVANKVKAGSAVPVKFSLGGYQGLDIFAAGYPASQPMSCSTSAPVDNIEETLTAGSSGLSYDATTDQYTYAWKTDKAWANSCRLLTVKLKDGTSHQAAFTFTK